MTRSVSPRAAGHFTSVMHLVTSGCAALCIAALTFAAQASANNTNRAGTVLSIPAIPATAKRTITVDDLSAVRAIDSLSVSADGQRYAILVRQAEPANNDYRLAWFAGNTRNDELVLLGDGGEARPRVMFTGHTPGEMGGTESLWSPDGQWLAYTVRKDDAVQLWRSRSDGSVQEQLTNHVADVREFAWSEDGKAIYFTAGTPRAELRAREQARAWQGYRYDEDFWTHTDLLGPQLIRPPETVLSSWTIALDARAQRSATEAERSALERARVIKARVIDVSEVAKRLPDDDLRMCQEAVAGQLICVRQTASQPAHVVSIDRHSARVQQLADINPEFRNLSLGKVERFEWDTPKFAWNEPGGELAGLYPARAYGYILYPPDFDPTRKYPVFIDPYIASGFNSLGAEHPLHAYAASGIVVLRTAFPMLTRSVGMQQMYSHELGYPHLTMLMESTLRALDVVAKRGFIDERRVGIGGVSHGTFVPLYMMQKHDRIAAISISSPHWGPAQYYSGTQKSRNALAAYQPRNSDTQKNSQRRGANFWDEIDIAAHVDTIEAPILMQLAAHETYALAPLIRNLADAGKPYDAYVFAAETHIKWQAAHLHAITRRNLDWFRFWLQDFEAPEPARAEQYLRWRELREQQRRSTAATRSRPPDSSASERR